MERGNTVFSHEDALLSHFSRVPLVILLSEPLRGKFDAFSKGFHFMAIVKLDLLINVPSLTPATARDCEQAGYTAALKAIAETLHHALSTVALTVPQSFSSGAYLGSPEAKKLARELSTRSRDDDCLKYAEDPESRTRRLEARRARDAARRANGKKTLIRS